MTMATWRLHCFTQEKLSLTSVLPTAAAPLPLEAAKPRQLEATYTLPLEAAMPRQLEATHTLPLEAAKPRQLEDTHPDPLEACPRELEELNAKSILRSLQPPSAL